MGNGFWGSGSRASLFCATFIFWRHFINYRNWGSSSIKGLVRNDVFTENFKRYMWIMVRFPAEESYFSLYRNVHTGSGTHPASIQRVRKYLSSREKRPRREDDHCLLPKLRMSGAVTPLHHKASWRAQGRAYLCMRYELATHSRLVLCQVVSSKYCILPPWREVQRQEWLGDYWFWYNYIPKTTAQSPRKLTPPFITRRSFKVLTKAGQWNVLWERWVQPSSSRNI